jgi:hypothetical protein
MARFCTQCGSPVAEELSFCTNCGAQVTAPPSAPEVSQPVATGPAPMGPTVAPTSATVPGKKGSPVVKIVLVVVAIFAFVTVASIGACVYIGYRAKRAVEQTVKMEEGGKSFKIQTPQGEIKLGEHPRKEGETIAGVPIYPGATALEGGGQFSFGDKFQIGGQDYLTSDPVDKVVDFYKEKYGAKLSVAEDAGHYRLALESGDEERSGVVTIDVFADEESGKTKITIAHMGGMK